MGLEGMLADPRFASLDDLITNSDAAAPFLIGRFGEEPTEHWWRLLREAGIWVSPVNRYDQLHTDPHILANNYIVTHEDGSIGVPVPFDVDAFTGVGGTASEYGADTDAVLGELGYDEEQLVELRVAGAIW